MRFKINNLVLLSLSMWHHAVVASISRGDHLHPRRATEETTYPTIKVTREVTRLSSPAQQDFKCNEFAGTIEITVPTTMSEDKTNFHTAKKQMSAMEMMVDYINQERCGVELSGLRYSLVLKSYSDEADTSQVERIAESTASTVGEFFFGPYSSGLTEAIAPITQREGKLLIAAGAASTSVFLDRPFAFGTLPPATKYIDEAVAGLARAGAKKIAALYEDVGFTISVCGRLPILADEHNMTLTSSTMTQAPPQVTELDALAEMFRDDEEPDVVVACVYNTGCKEWIKAMRRSDWSPKAQVFTVCVGDEVLKDELGSDLYGVMGVTPWDRSQEAVDNLTQWNATEFATRFEAFSSVDATYHSASAAASVVILVKAIERAGSTDAAAVAAALNDEQGFDTFYGKVFFDEAGQNANTNLAIQYDEDLEIQTVLPDEISSSPLIYPLPSWALRDCMFSLDCAECNADGTCNEDDENDVNKAVVISVSVVAGLLLIGILFLAYRMRKLSAYTKELETRGEQVPRMSLLQKASSVRLSIASVVGNAAELESKKLDGKHISDGLKVEEEEDKEEEEIGA
jgi:branched-chain amino acid transport system substrate-binding protein